jgi:integrase
MASDIKGKKVRENGSVQYVIKKAGLLPKPLYFTFDDEKTGDAYVARVKAMLDKGIIPADMAPKLKKRTLSIQDLVHEYERDAHPSEKDKGQLTSVIRTKGSTPLGDINAAWVDTWITEMKRKDVLAPGTIRARIGAMARCADWGIRKGHLVLPDAPFRTLPEGYATYTKIDAQIAGEKKEDVERDRRLEGDEYEKILKVIDSGVLPREQRPRVLEHKAAWRCLFVLAVESAMRLREMYTLTLDQVDLKKRTVFLEKTKNGDKRQVPLSSVAVSALKDYIKVREIPDEHAQDLLFPWWNGVSTTKALAEVTREVGKVFQSDRKNGIFDVAGCEDLRFHDLRHEATSRLFEKTTLSEFEIAKITGHKDMKMLARYANLRGSNLASKLW